MSSLLISQFYHHLVQIYLKLPVRAADPDWLVSQSDAATVWVNSVTGLTVILQHESGGSASYTQQQLFSVWLMLSDWHQ